MLKPVQFAASLRVNEKDITTHKGEAYTQTLTKVAESFTDDFAQLPENIKSFSVGQEYVHVPHKGSALDLFVPFFILKSMAGGYNGSNAATANTQVSIEGIGPRGGRHQKTIALDPQTLEPKKVLGLFKRAPKPAELQTLEQQFQTFFQNVLEQAKAFSTSLEPKPRKSAAKTDADATPE